MFLTDSDLQSIWLTIKLASIVTFILLIIGTPIAWWLARTPSRLKGTLGAVVALPLVFRADPRWQAHFANALKAHSATMGAHPTWFETDDVIAHAKIGLTSGVVWVTSTP